jgi:ribosomal protein S6--L-glutamate ligase
MADLITLGWRERLALPQLGIGMLKAKLDTGARSSSLHVDTLESFQRDGETWLRFTIHSAGVSRWTCAAKRRHWIGALVTDTGGGRTERWFIRTEVQLAGQCFERRHQSDRSSAYAVSPAAGAQRLVGRFTVDPALSYTQSRRPWRTFHDGQVMKIAILSRNTRLYSTKRLVEAARERGHVVRVLDPLRCYVRIAPGAVAIRYKGKACAISMRDSAHRHHQHVLRHRRAASAGNDGRVHAQSFRCRAARARQVALPADSRRQGIDMPVTVFGDNPDDTADVLDLLGDPPHVIKLNEGSQGTGVVLAEKRSASQSVIEAFRGCTPTFWCRSSSPKRRAATCAVSWSAVKSWRRCSATPVPGEFRANLHRGGTRQGREGDAEEKRIAVARPALGLGIAGVDLLRSNRGPLLLEVNASPGLEGIEAATGVNVAERSSATLSRMPRRRKRVNGRNRCERGLTVT